VTVKRWCENPVSGGPEVVLASDYDALAARLAEAERLLLGVARGGYPAGMAALLQDITQYFRAAETVSEGEK
jgi:hypothetical protein